MNSSRLLEITSLLLKMEQKYQVQQRLNEVVSSIAQLVSQPNLPQFQQIYAQSLNALQSANNSMQSELEPSTISQIKELNGSVYFLSDISKTIAEWNSENGMTPAVAQQNISGWTNERQQCINDITQLNSNLTKIGITNHELNLGEAEIGVLLPRPLFHDNLEGLIKELNTINIIMRFFSEIATGTPEEISVRQISTSDPLFFFGLSIESIALIGAAVTWALNTYKQLEDIRKVRAETARVLSPDDASTMFDKKIEEKIQSLLNSESSKLLENFNGKKDRKSELSNGMDWALKSILARVERGMRVEIRLLPPKSLETSVDDLASDKFKPYNRLSEIIPQLSFPDIIENPVLSLPSSEYPVISNSQKTVGKKQEKNAVASKDD